MKKRLIGILMAFFMIVALFPVSAFAAETEASEGEAVETAWPDLYIPLEKGSFLCFGQYSYLPIKWKVLDPELNSIKEPGMFLISQTLCASWGIAFSADPENLAWEGSVAQNWCKNTLLQYFQEQEREMLQTVSKKDPEFDCYGRAWESSELLGDQAFFLSAQEAAEYIGSENGAPGLTATAFDGGWGYWWLRSPVAGGEGTVGLVVDRDRVLDAQCREGRGARPGINLDLGKALLFTPAIDRQPLGSISEVVDPGDQGWKLTVLDESRPFALTGARVEGNILEVSYTGATVGFNNFISVVIRDDRGAPVAYGRLVKPEIEDGTVQLDLDQIQIPEGGTLSLFSELENGDNKTDFASALQTVSFRLEFQPGEGSGKMEPIYAPLGKAIGIPECTFQAKTGRAFDHWELNGKPVDENTRYTNNSVLKAIYSDAVAKEIVFDKPEITMALFEETVASGRVLPEDAINTNFHWTGDGTAVADVVDNGDGTCTITAKYPGHTSIVAESDDGHARAELLVTVEGDATLARAVTYKVPLTIAAVALLAVLVAVIVIVIRRNRSRWGDM